MKLRPIDSSEIELVADWLGQKENYQWLDFGKGKQGISPAALKIMTQRDIHLLRVFTSDEDDAPIGLVALSNIDRSFKTATLWVLLGDKRFSGKSYTTRATSIKDPLTQVRHLRDVCLNELSYSAHIWCRRISGLIWVHNRPLDRGPEVP